MMYSRWLLANIPPEGKAAVVHGDFRLDNLMLSNHSAECLAVLDWYKSFASPFYSVSPLLSLSLTHTLSHDFADCLAILD